MRTRVKTLEARVSEQRAEAVTLQQSGQKPQAVRALRRAKATEMQIVHSQSALDACEQQLDLLAQTALQKQLTSALASTSKKMKKDSKSLECAESAVDDAADARDMANDLDVAVADFARAGQPNVDDDDLEAELASMVAIKIGAEESTLPEVPLQLPAVPRRREEHSALLPKHVAFFGLSI